MAANGMIPKSDLKALPARWSNKREVEYLRTDAADSLSRALSRAVAESGANFELYDAYRSLAEQVSVLKAYYRAVPGPRKDGDRSYQGVTYRRRPGSPAAASPGYSNHGEGLAIDIHPGPIQQWFKTAGRAYGWTWDEGQKLGESWHFVYEPALDRHKAEGWLDHAAVQRVVGATVDGKIGTGTVAKIKQWQAAHGLDADGKVGPATKSAMSLAGKAPAAPEVDPLADADRTGAATDYVLEHHQTKNLRPGRVDKKRGLKGELKVITIHYWGGLGQRFENVVGWLVADGNGNNNSSAHEVIEGGRVAVLADIKDGTWNSGSAQGNLDNYALECRPEADPLTIRTVAARIAEVRRMAGKDLPLNVHSDYVSTSCPGPYRELLGELDRLARGGKAQLSTPTPVKPKLPSVKRLAVDGKFGPATAKALQVFLVSRGYTLTVDSKIGPASWRAFQAYLHTPIDGRVSAQYRRAAQVGTGITGGWDYVGRGAKGSTMVRALQLWVGVKTDGIWGPDTTRGLQAKLNVHGVGM